MRTGSLAAVVIGATAGWVAWFAWEWNLDTTSTEKFHQLGFVVLGAVIAVLATNGVPSLGLSP